MTEAKRSEAASPFTEINGMLREMYPPGHAVERLAACHKKLEAAGEDMESLRARRAFLEARVAELGRIYEALCEVAQLMADENDVDDVIGLASLRGILALEEEDGG